VQKFRSLKVTSGGHLFRRAFSPEPVVQAAIDFGTEIAKNSAQLTKLHAETFGGQVVAASISPRKSAFMSEALTRFPIRVTSCLWP
jgi:hypothetical protein